MPRVGGFVKPIPNGVVIAEWSYDDVQLYQPGHTIHNWAKRVERELGVAITDAAPRNKRTNKSKSQQTYGGITPVGYLKSQISTSFQRTGARRIDFSATSGAEYSQAVIFGTKGGSKIGGARGGSRKGFFLLPRNPGFGFIREHRSFSGQAPNDFMTRGFNKVAAVHPALR